MVCDTSQGLEDGVNHMADIAHLSAAVTRFHSPKSPATSVLSDHKRQGMPVRDNDPYDGAAVRKAIEMALEKAGKARSSVGQNQGMGERLIGKFLSGGSQTITLANAVRLASALGLTVSELIGEVMPPEQAMEATAEEETALEEQLENALLEIQDALIGLRRRRRKPRQSR